MDPGDVSEPLLLWAMGLSLVAVVATAIGVPWVVARLPADYFSKPERSAWRGAPGQPVLAAALGVAKNALGALLVLLGIVMLVTPGQGLLTLLIGLLLINFPGKYRLECWLVSRPGVMTALNWLRQRHGRRPFEAPPDSMGEA